MSPFKALIAKLIEAEGPMPLSDYMALCLGHPDYGYYQSKEPFGRGGDFITAPEISQMFGELIGAWIADLWTRQGKPQGAALVELGPGRGTLMSDIRRTLKSVPEWPRETPVHLVETSKRLRAQQKAAHPDANWFDSFEDVPRTGPLYIMANELFDALPIRQFIRRGDVWKERSVVNSAGALGLADTATSIPVAAPKEAEDGDIWELCQAGRTLMREIAHAIKTSGGAALVIDYGFTKHAFGDTVQAIEKARFGDPFENPGEADLTAHVNFAMLKETALEAGAAAHGPTTQGAFLLDLGLPLRARALGGPALRDAARLADPEAMGDLFKVLAVTPPGSPIPAGFGR